MKRMYVRVSTGIIAASLLFLASYSTRPNANQYSLQSANQLVLEDSSSEVIDLDKLLKDFSVPTQVIKTNLGKENLVFPTDIVDKVKFAVNRNDIKPLIKNFKDESLLIGVKDFSFEPSNNDQDYYENQLNEIIANGGLDYYIYKCHDIGQIIMIEKESSDESYKSVYILKKEEESYIYHNFQTFDYVEDFAIFKNDKSYYLITEIKTEDNSTNVGLMLLKDIDWFNNDYIEIFIQTDPLYTYNNIYTNANQPMVKDVEKYLDEIKIDLTYIDQINRTFLGNEVDEFQLSDNIKIEGLDIDNLYSTHVNNTDKELFFNRNNDFNTDTFLYEYKINWINPDTNQVYNPEFNFWNPDNYNLSQCWFKNICDETIAFSLYKETDGEKYVLDVRIFVDDKTILLSDYLLTPEKTVVSAEDYSIKNTNFVNIDYKYVGKKQPSSNVFYKDIETLYNEINRDFIPVYYKHEAIPNGLITVLESALYNKDFFDTDLNSSSYLYDKEEFYNLYKDFLEYDNIKDFIYHTINIYAFKSNNKEYFLIVSSTFPNNYYRIIDIYEKNHNGISLVKSWEIDNTFADIIEYDDQIYILETLNNKFTKSINGFVIHVIDDFKKDNNLVITFKQDKFTWKQNYTNEVLDKEINQYIESIKDDLMDISSYNNETMEIFTGKETSQFNHDKNVRLKAFSNLGLFYEIDFNNDGKLEYINKNHLTADIPHISMFLQNSIYQFSDNRIVTLDKEFYDSEASVLQMWFKEIEGKVYTFILCTRNSDSYFLNVSLVEGSQVTQMQSHIIVPENKFAFKTDLAR